MVNVAADFDGPDAHSAVQPMVWNHWRKFL